MKAWKWGVIFLLIFSFGILTFADSTFTTAENVTMVAKAENQFAIDLYGKLKSSEGNLFFSPFSIYDALAMTYVGAGGETESQMASVLHINMLRNEFNTAFSSFLKKIGSDQNGDYTLDIANALWCQKGFDFLESYISTIKDYYAGELHTLDFSNGLKAAEEINGWVEEKTHGKIDKIVGKIDPMTKLILINAVYFKGEWVAGFSTSLTKPATFYVKPDKTVEIPMMYREGKYGYMESANLQALVMPYKGDSLSMVVLLPKNRYGLSEVENTLSATNLERWIDEMKTEKVKVYFPKFKLKTSYDLKKTLKSMGMADAFGNANFSGMDGRKDLVISEIMHKAYIDVNEKGTEAAAVTTVVVKLTCSPYSHPKTIHVFRADHPFIFFIMNNRTGAILFMGRVFNP